MVDTKEKSVAVNWEIILQNCQSEYACPKRGSGFDSKRRENSEFEEPNPETEED